MKTTKVPLVTKWWTVIRRMRSGAVGMESIGTVKAFKDEKPYAIMPWSYYLYLMRIVRRLGRHKFRGDISYPLEIVQAIEASRKLLSGQARKRVKGEK